MYANIEPPLAVINSDRTETSLCSHRAESLTEVRLRQDHAVLISDAELKSTLNALIEKDNSLTQDFEIQMAKIYHQ